MKNTDRQRTPVALTKGTADGQLRLVIRDCALKALERVYDPAADLRTLATQMRDTAAVVVAELGPPPPVQMRESEVA
jgi:hypothetical protein